MSHPLGLHPMQVALALEDLPRMALEREPSSTFHPKKTR